MHCPSTAITWRCPTCGSDLAGPAPLQCATCGRGPRTNGRFFDFMPITPQLSIGLAAIIQKLHEKAGTSYPDLTGNPRVARAVQRISQYARGGLCLEIGAANGPMTPALENLFGCVIALDHSESLLAQNIQRTRSAICILADAHYLPLPDDSVDFVALTEVLEHSVVPTQLLLEILRVLKPLGMVFITVPNNRVLNPFTVTKQRVVADTHVNFFDTVGLSRLMVRCGFELIDIRTYTPGLKIRKMLRAPSRLRRYLPALGKYVECLARPSAHPLDCWQNMLARYGE